MPDGPLPDDLGSVALHVVVLAAGHATRFGGGKLDAVCAGKRLGDWVLDAVAEADLPCGTIVTGPDSPAFAADASDWKRLTNSTPEAGLGISLAIAARDAISRGAAAMLVLLADMPLVTPEYLRRLLHAGAPAATAHAEGRPGVPALFGRSSFTQLAALTGDRGAGPMLRQLAGLTLLDPPLELLLDIDRPEDLARAEAALASR